MSTKGFKSTPGKSMDLCCQRTALYIMMNCILYGYHSHGFYGVDRHRVCALNPEDSASGEGGFLGKIWKHVPALLASGALLVSPMSMDNMAQATTLSPEELRTVKLFKKNTSAVVNVTNLGMRYEAKQGRII